MSETITPPKLRSYNCNIIGAEGTIEGLKKKVKEANIPAHLKEYIVTEIHGTDDKHNFGKLDLHVTEEKGRINVHLSFIPSTILT